MAVATSSTIQEFNGLRNDLPDSKCPQGYSPDCSDMVFRPGEAATRFPFRTVQAQLPSPIKWREDFLSKDGTQKTVILTQDGNLYSYSSLIGLTLIDSVTPGCSATSVTAYGRQYMAFFNQNGGCDRPRQWDGINIDRVSQDGPGAPPTVSNLRLPQQGISGGITRANNKVTLTTGAPHQLKPGYMVQIDGVPNGFLGSISSVVVLNGVATVDISGSHNLSPGDFVFLEGIENQVAGGLVTSLVRSAGLVTATFTTPPGLTAGDFFTLNGSAAPVPATASIFDGAFAVQFVVAPLVIQYLQDAEDATSHGGTIQIIWTNPDDGVTVTGTPSPSSFTFDTGNPDGIYNIAITGNGVFDQWTGKFFVTDVPTPTTVVYQQQGPDNTNAPTGTLTPFGQISAGDHLIRQHFLTRTGALTAPSDYVKFTADGGAYLKVDDLAIGPSNVVARIISCTGAFGSKLFYLPVPAQVGGLQVSTSTVVNDNVTTSVILDFSDLSLLSALAVDTPGNNTLQQVPLNTPDGVEWYANRLFWKGEKNTVTGLKNMGMAGGVSESFLGTPLGWTAVGAGGVVNNSSAPTYRVDGPGTGEITQEIGKTQDGALILQPDTQYTARFWVDNQSVRVGQLVMRLISNSIVIAEAIFFLSHVTNTGSAFYTADFSAKTPVTLPAQITLSVLFQNLPPGSSATVSDLEIVYTQNPNRNPVARPSYVANPEAYDALTGNIGPADDPGELKAMFLLYNSLHFLTTTRLYSVDQIGNAEPSSWTPLMVSDECGAFNANSVTTGAGWAAWAGPLGAFWYAGGIPQRISNTIKGTWKTVTSVNRVLNDADAQRVYMCRQDLPMLVYDYHEVESGGVGKWSPWARTISWLSPSTEFGTLFAFGSDFLKLDTEQGIADDVGGNINGYYTLAPFAKSPLQKLYNYFFTNISGTGPLAPALYTKSLQNLTASLRSQLLQNLLDIEAEWPVNIKGRMLFVKFGEGGGVAFQLQEVTVAWANDPNAPVSGVR